MENGGIINPAQKSAGLTKKNYLLFIKFKCKLYMSNYFK